MAERDEQQDEQVHAEGQHGDKTHRAFTDAVETPTDKPTRQADDPHGGSPFGEVESDGRHRLSEDRQQHDEAEKNSEHRKEGRESPRR